MKKLFVAWQDPISRAWYPIGRLTFENNCYQFVYIQGALEAREKVAFQGLWSFPDFNKVYQSPELFAFFFNRIMRPARPDYPLFIESLNLKETEVDPMTLLSRSGGRKVTDNYEVFPYPEADTNGFYHLYFFLHALRYMPSEINERIKKLELGETLYLMHDSQNDFDSNALMLRTKDFYLLGFCPRYLLDDIFPLVQSQPQAIEIKVDRLNQPPASLQMKLLCHLIVKKEDFQPFSSQMYEPLALPAFT